MKTVNTAPGCVVALSVLPSETAVGFASPVPSSATGSLASSRDVTFVSFLSGPQKRPRMFLIQYTFSNISEICARRSYKNIFQT